MKRRGSRGGGGGQGAPGGAIPQVTLSVNNVQHSKVSPTANRAGAANFFQKKPEE